MPMRAHLRSGQQGIISMVAVIFISILLSLLAVGLARVTSDEQRSATDLLLSTRALYAAESGVQDAIYDVRVGGTPTGGACHSSSNLTPDISNTDANKSSYTCVLVEGGQSIDETVPHNRSYTLDLGSVSSGASIKLDWFLAGTDLPLGGYDLSLFDGSGDNPQCGTSVQTANCASPPIMKLDLIGTPTGGFQRDQIRRKVLLLRPSTSAGAASTAFSGVGNLGDTADQRNSLCNAASPNGSYMCSQTINGFTSTYRYTMVITPLYQQRDVVTNRSGTHFKVGVVGGTGQLARTVDVTARSNDVFRRVVYSFSPTGSSLVPNFALLSDIPFCKNPYVNASNGAVVGGTSPLTACR